jgi:hypothetical protein
VTPPRQEPLTPCDGGAPHAAVTRREILLARLRCHYADGVGHVERPHCQQVAAVAYGTIVLCAMCDTMRSAGRNVPRKVPGAQLNELAVAAVALAKAEESLAKAAFDARAAGASWSQVGDAMSITRQAAQQRFGQQERLAKLRVAK